MNWSDWRSAIPETGESSPKWWPYLRGTLAWVGAIAIVRLAIGMMT